MADVRCIGVVKGTGLSALPTASGEGVVVAVSAGSVPDATKDLESLGDVTSLGGRLLLVRPSATAKSARALWTQALRRCEGAEWACPVLKDADGNALFPTGPIVVRFHEPPSKAALRRVGGTTVLAVGERNEFVPRQVTFRPRRPREVYLPELAVRMAKRPEVESAWLATRGRYERA